MSETETEFTEEVNEETGEHQQSEGRNYEAEARDMGWVPKEEWKGDPEQWRDAKDFVRRGEEFLPYVRAQLRREQEAREKDKKDFEERIKRLDKTSRDALERQAKHYEAQMADLDNRERQAVEEGDVKGWEALRKQKEDLGPPPEVPKEEEVSGAQADQPPEVKAWAKENTWFYTDTEMRALAIGVAGRVAEAGGDVETQLKAATDEVRRRFPEKFGNGEDRRDPPQAVETGAQQPRRTKRGKGFSDLPKEAHEAFQRFVRLNVYKDDKEGREKYAKGYWEQD